MRGCFTGRWKSRYSRGTLSAELSTRATASFRSIRRSTSRPASPFGVFTFSAVFPPSLPGWAFRDVPTRPINIGISRRDIGSTAGGRAHTMNGSNRCHGDRALPPGKRRPRPFDGGILKGCRDRVTGRIFHRIPFPDRSERRDFDGMRHRNTPNGSTSPHPSGMRCVLSRDPVVARSFVLVQRHALSALPPAVFLPSLPGWAFRNVPTRPINIGISRRDIRNTAGAAYTMMLAFSLRSVLINQRPSGRPARLGRRPRDD